MQFHPKYIEAILEEDLNKVVPEFWDNLFRISCTSNSRKFILKYKKYYANSSHQLVADLPEDFLKDHCYGVYRTWYDLTTIDYLSLDLSKYNLSEVFWQNIPYKFCELDKINSDTVESCHHKIAWRQLTEIVKDTACKNKANSRFKDEMLLKYIDNYNQYLNQDDWKLISEMPLDFDIIDKYFDFVDITVTLQSHLTDCEVLRLIVNRINNSTLEPAPHGYIWRTISKNPNVLDNDQFMIDFCDYLDWQALANKIKANPDLFAAGKDRYKIIKLARKNAKVKSVLIQKLFQTDMTTFKLYESNDGALNNE